jgi:hypothetical protein
MVCEPTGRRRMPGTRADRLAAERDVGPAVLDVDRDAAVDDGALERAVDVDRGAGGEVDLECDRLEVRLGDDERCGRRRAQVAAIERGGADRLAIDLDERAGRTGLDPERRVRRDQRGDHPDPLARVCGDVVAPRLVALELDRDPVRGVSARPRPR